MDYFAIDCAARKSHKGQQTSHKALWGRVHVSSFTGDSGTRECHIMVRPTEGERLGFERQLEDLLSAYRHVLDVLHLPPQTAVLRRFFCSDLNNQTSALESFPMANPRKPDVPCAISWIGQPPAPPAKAALWAYHIEDPRGELDKIQEGASLALRRGNHVHRWTVGLTSAGTGCASPEADSSGTQTQGILEQYNEMLRSHSMTMADHVVRTWFYLRNIDVNYKGMAAARREFFARNGLTPQTHFIASTGIEGASADPKALVGLDAYSISGLAPGQVEFINAADHLCPTHLYGVTFERAASVAWRDRKHVIVSGTASIDNQGNILHPGDVSRQLDRTIENLGALLKQAGAGFNDVGMFLVYLRDPADHAFVWRRMREHFSQIPFEILTAPVCRPGWLIEIEGLATIPSSLPSSTPQWPEF